VFQAAVHLDISIHTTCNAELAAAPAWTGMTCIDGAAQAVMQSQSRTEPSALKSAFSVHVCLDIREKLIWG